MEAVDAVNTITEELERQKANDLRMNPHMIASSTNPENIQSGIYFHDSEKDTNLGSFRHTDKGDDSNTLAQTISSYRESYGHSAQKNPQFVTQDSSKNAPVKQTSPNGNNITIPDMYSEPTIEPIYDRKYPQFVRNPNYFYLRVCVVKQNQYEEVYNEFQHSVRGSEIQPLPEEDSVEQKPAPVASPQEHSRSLEAKAKIEEISKGLIHDDQPDLAAPNNNVVLHTSGGTLEGPSQVDITRQNDQSGYFDNGQHHQDYDDGPIVAPNNNQSSSPKHEDVQPLNNQDNDNILATPTPQALQAPGPSRTTGGKTRNVKLMSRLLIAQKTPKSIRGMDIDDNLKLKMSSRKSKVLSLKIEIDEPDYDEEGKLIHKEVGSDDEEDYNPNLDGIFAAELLDEEYLDAQEYTGELSPGELKKIELEKQKAELKKRELEERQEEDIQADLKKHLNVEFMDQEVPEYVEQEEDENEEGVLHRGLSIDLDNQQSLVHHVNSNMQSDYINMSRNHSNNGGSLQQSYQEVANSLNSNGLRQTDLRDIIGHQNSEVSPEKIDVQ